MRNFGCAGPELGESTGKGGTGDGGAESKQCRCESQWVNAPGLECVECFKHTMGLPGTRVQHGHGN